MFERALDMVRGAFPGIRAYVVIVAVFFVVERFFPADRNYSYRSAWFNFRYTLLLILFGPLIMLWPAFVAAYFAKTWGSAVSIDLNQITVGVPAMDWPIRAIVLPLMPLFVFDFFYYWHHRFQHRIPVFWEQHKLHHLERSLSVLTNYRHHWTEDAIRLFTITIPMTLILSLTPVQSFVVGFLISYWSFFIHANIRLPLGPFTPVFAGPQLHRIHHSREAEHLSKNYAAFFPVWDIVFGTYYRPRRHEWPATGIKDEPDIHSVWRASILPFRNYIKRIRGRWAAEYEAPATKTPS